jgi:hypothetical protein
MAKIGPIFARLKLLLRYEESRVIGIRIRNSGPNLP